MYKSNNLAEQLLLFLQSETSTAREGCASFMEYLGKSRDLAFAEGNMSAYHKLASTINRLLEFLQQTKGGKGEDLTFAELTPEFLLGFEKHLKKGFVSLNTSSFYMRILRSYFHKGIAEGLYFTIKDPFKGIYTGTSKTRKRAVNLDVLSRLISEQLPQRLHFSRDIFMFSFYMRGMSFVDIAKLKRENITNSEVRYCRSKTGQVIRVALEPCVEEIIGKYRHLSGCDYLFPILMKNGRPLKYNTSLKNFNNHLKEISAILNLDKPITSYVARHSWASIAKEDGIPISTISEGMGHTSERTTMIYLTSIGQKTIDDANRLIIQSLNQREKI